MKIPKTLSLKGFVLTLCRVSSGWLSEVEFILSEAEVTSPLEPDFDFAQSSILSNLNAIKLLKTIELTLIKSANTIVALAVEAMIQVSLQRSNDLPYCLDHFLTQAELPKLLLCGTTNRSR